MSLWAMRLAADVRAAAVRDERWQVRGGARRDVLNERRGDHCELHLCIVHIRAFGVADSKTRRAASSMRATAGSVHWRRGSFITRDLYVMADLVVSLGELLEADNAYYCESCEGKTDAVKRVVVKSLPQNS